MKENTIVNFEEKDPKQSEITALRLERLKSMYVVTIKAQKTNNFRALVAYMETLPDAEEPTVENIMSTVNKEQRLISVATSNPVWLLKSLELNEVISPAITSEVIKTFGTEPVASLLAKFSGINNGVKKPSRVEEQETSAPAATTSVAH